VTPFCGAHRVPRAGRDVIDGATPALAVIGLAMARPLVAETLGIVLDAQRRGSSIVVVDGTVWPDAFFDVVERLADAIALSGELGGLVLATIRPGGGLLPDDGDRWMEASSIAELVGVELVEWFVIGDGGGPPDVWCHRDLIAEPPRWLP